MKNFTLFSQRLLLSIASILMVLGAVEGVSALLLKWGPVRQDSPRIKMGPRALFPSEIRATLSEMPRFQTAPFLPPQANMEWEDLHEYRLPGVHLAKNFSGRSRRTLRGTPTVVYDVKVSTDEWGRRRSRLANSPQHTSAHLLMVGCSFTFGSAIDDEATLAWQINEQQSQFEAYNQGVDGLGTADVLAQFLTEDGMRGVTPKNGILLYTFIEDHIFRTLGSSSISWIGSMTHLQETSEGQFVVDGTHDSARPYLRAFYRWFAGLNLTKYFGLSLPLLQNSDYDLIARQLVQLQRLYQEQSQAENPLVVVIYPQPIRRIDLTQFLAALSRHHIRFIDYSSEEISNFVDGKALVDLDGHPNAAANRVFAQALVRDLGPVLNSH